jgi:poly(beta-D-mannuronate) lyase
MAEIISNKSCKNTYSDNGFYECKGTLTLRHGNDCLVTGNYFIGNNISQTGGVRIIGENHVVENNRFETLGGEGYKSALCIVRGQENNPLNGYAPVKNAIIRDNIFLDCKLSMHINYKGTSSQSLAPISTQINHNTIIAIDSPLFLVSAPNAVLVIIEPSLCYFDFVLTITTEKGHSPFYWKMSF